MNLYRLYITKLAAKSPISWSQALDNKGEDHGLFGKVTSHKHGPRIYSALSRVAKDARPIAKDVSYSRRYKRYLFEATSTKRDTSGRIAPVAMAIHTSHKITPDYIHHIATKHGRTIDPTHASGLAQAIAKHKSRRALNRKLLIVGGTTLAAAAAGYGVHRALKKHREAKQKAGQ